MLFDHADLGVTGGKMLIRKMLIVTADCKNRM